MTSTTETTNCCTFTGTFAHLGKAANAMAGFALLASPTVGSANDEAERLHKGVVVLDEIMAAPDSAIPPEGVRGALPWSAPRGS